jgi:UDP-glucose 4-epimerase
MSTVLITGGAGFIGSHVAEALISNGSTVRVLDNVSTGREEWVPSAATLIRGDVRDRETVTTAAEGCSAVFHLAAMARSGPSMELLHECVSVNVIGTENVIHACVEHDVPHVIYSGSSTYYGMQDAPNRVGDRPDFMNYYGATKGFGESLLEVAARHDLFRVTTLRYFNVYGPRQPTTGQYALVIGIFLDRLKRGLPLTVHGSGSQRRDFVHVKDVARANLLSYLSVPTQRHRLMNIGSGVNVSIMELASTLSAKIEHGPPRQGDAAETLADLREANEFIGWFPEVSLGQGLRELCAELGVSVPEGSG